MIKLKSKINILTYTFLYVIFIPTIIIEVAVLAVLGSTFGSSAILLGSSTITIESLLLLLGLVSYIKQRS